MRLYDDLVGMFRQQRSSEMGNHFAGSVPQWSVAFRCSLFAVRLSLIRFLARADVGLAKHDWLLRNFSQTAVCK